MTEKPELGNDQKEERKSFLSKVPGFRSGKLWKKIVATFGYFFIFLIVVSFFTSNSNTTKTGDVSTAERLEAGEIQESTPKSEPEETETKKEDTLKAQQDAFKNWYTDFEKNCSDFDEVWKLWQTTIKGFSEGSVDRYKAYSSIKQVRDYLKSVKSNFYAMNAPEILSKEHRNLLEKAAESMGTATYCRENAAKIFMEFLDDPKPSLMEKAKEEISSADAFVLDAAAKVVSVQQELGLIEKNNENKQ